LAEFQSPAASGASISTTGTTLSDTGAPSFPEGEGGSKGVSGFKAETLEDRWILSRFNRVAQEIHQALETYRFHEAAHVVYHFFWGEYCAWYLELIKPRLLAEDREQVRTAYGNLISIFEGALRMLSPFMPFITEELWHAVYDGKPPAKSIALMPYPQCDPAQVDADAEVGMAILQDLIVSVRNIRAELKVDQKQKLAIEIFADSDVRSLFEQNRGALERLANVESVTFVESSLAKASGARSTARFEVRVIYERKIDAAAERDRLSKELTKLTQELARATAQLNNDAFLSKAPAQVVAGLKKRKSEVEMLVQKTSEALGELGA
jgi:valyl-tRNA synthetase